MEEKVLLISLQDRLKTEVLYNRLQENGIECWLLNKQDSSYMTFGHFEIYINQKDEKLAKELLS